ncbi:MAG: hypothetical protein ACOYXT_17160 [Bacteroidota bacterium]
MNIDDFKELYSLIVGTISSIVTVLLLDKLEQKIQNKKLTTVFTVIIVSIFVVTASFLLNQLIDNSSYVRKLFSSKDFVEGWWYEDNSKHKTLMNIEYVGGDLVVYGETFDSTGHCYANFKSIVSAYESSNFFFQYASYNIRNDGVGQGFDQLQFNNPPSSYKGFVYSFSQKKFFPIEGFKVDDATLLQHDFFSNADVKKTFVLNLFAKKNTITGVKEVSND